MRILMLSPYPPYPPHSGGALRIYNLLRGLAQRHDLWCLTFAPDAAARTALAPLGQFCRLLTVQGPPRRSLAQRGWTTLSTVLPDLALRNRSPAYTAVLHELLRQRQFDIIQAESIEMTDYGLMGAGTGATLVLDEFNAEYVLQRRAALNELRRLWDAGTSQKSTGRHLGPRATLRAMVGAIYSLVQWGKLAAYERQALCHYDHVVAVSAEDQLALQRLRLQGWPAPPGGATISIVPNGVDTAYFQRPAPLPPPGLPASSPADSPVSQPTRPQVRDLVFTGSLDFRPNVDAVLWFATFVLPLIQVRQPTARFVIVGRTPVPAVRALHDGASIIVRPDVPDVRPYIAQAAVYVVPIRIGGGIRFKLLEALAMQAAVVSTGMGAEGIHELRNGEHFLLANTTYAFAEATLRLLDNPTLGRQLGAAGSAMVRHHYDWREIIPQMEHVYSLPPAPLPPAFSDAALPSSVGRAEREE